MPDDLAAWRRIAAVEAEIVWNMRHVWIGMPYPTGTYFYRPGIDAMEAGNRCRAHAKALAKLEARHAKHQ